MAKSEELYGTVICFYQSFLEKAEAEDDKLFDQNWKEKAIFINTQMDILSEAAQNNYIRAIEVYLKNTKTNCKDNHSVKFQERTTKQNIREQSFKLNVEMKNAIDGELVPFYQIHDSRYMLYWLALSKNGYQSYIDSLSAIENQKIILSQRSTDFVSPGEQQPEADHFMQSEKSNSGNDHNEFFRNASNGGFFSYELKTQGVEKLSVYVKYWGVNHWGTKIFDILSNDLNLLICFNILFIAK